MAVEPPKDVSVQSCPSSELSSKKPCHSEINGEWVIFPLSFLLFNSRRLKLREWTTQQSLGSRDKEAGMRAMGPPSLSHRAIVEDGAGEGGRGDSPPLRSSQPLPLGCGRDAGVISPGLPSLQQESELQRHSWAPTFSGHRLYSEGGAASFCDSPAEPSRGATPSHPPRSRPWPHRIPVYPVRGRDSDCLLSQHRLVQLTQCLTSKWVPESRSTRLGASLPTAPRLPGPLQSGAQSNSLLCAWPLSCLPGQGAQGGKSDGWAGKAVGTGWGASSEGLPHTTPQAELGQSGG